MTFRPFWKFLEYPVRHYPAYYPAKIELRVSEEDFAKFQWDYDDKAKDFGRKHYLANWLSVNMVVTISWESWINLDPFVRRALELEVEEIIGKRETERSRQKSEMELSRAKQNSELKFLDTSNSVIGNIIRR